jgi:transcriptional regulator with XRE-family HTH domain
MTRHNGDTGSNGNGATNGEAMTIGEAIKAMRKKRGLRARDVGEGCNVSRSRVYSWEQSDYIKPKNFKNLAAVLRISIKKLEALNRK